MEMAEPHRVTHLFANGITCTFLFDPELHYHAEAKSIFDAKHWSHKFDDAEAAVLLPEYRARAHTVHEEIANLQGEPLHLRAPGQFGGAALLGVLDLSAERPPEMRRKRPGESRPETDGPERPAAMSR